MMAARNAITILAIAYTIVAIIDAACARWPA